MNLENIESVTVYREDECAAFMRSRDQYGDLSNMTFGFRLRVNNMPFQSSEGLYQALKFPEQPRVQKEIGAARPGMDAKKVAYRDREPRHDWDDVRIRAMALTIAIKLSQHPDRFGAAQAEPAGLPIVEKSFRDQFWGAKPNGRRLTGANVLGKILTGTATMLERTDDAQMTAATLITAAQPQLFKVNGRPVDVAVLQV